MCGCGRTSWCAPAATSIGPKWSKKTNGPTERRSAAGRSLLTMKPPPRSFRCGTRACNCVTERLPRLRSAQCRRLLESAVHSLRQELLPGPPMSLKCGIVGLPNVGKSTLFNALTKAGIAAENYPFCTIEPNVGVVEVPDPRLAALAAIVKPERVVPAIVEFVDIAGLVAGASKGEGLGNQFLSHIRETDAIVNVVRCFEDSNVIHVAGKVDPVADIEVIQTELCLADLATVDKSLQRNTKLAKAGGDKEAQRLVDVLNRCQAALNDGKPVRALVFSKEEQAVLKPLCLITAKPAMYVANVAEDGFTGNPLLQRLESFAQLERAPVVAISAKTEAELAEMDEADRQLFL